MDHIFFNLFGLVREEEDDSSFASILTRKWSKDGTDAMVLLPWKELREMQHENLCFYHLRKIKSLQFYMKNFQEKGLFSLDGSFDYSTIDDPEFRKFINDPTSIH